MEGELTYSMSSIWSVSLWSRSDIMCNDQVTVKFCVGLDTKGLGD